MQRVRPNITPEAIQTDPGGGGLGTSHLEDARSDPQTSVGSDDLDAGYPLGQLAALPDGQLVPLRGVLGIDRVHDQASFIGQGLSSTEMSEEVAVCGEDVKLLRCFTLVLRPQPCQLVKTESKTLNRECDLRLHRMAMPWC